MSTITQSQPMRPSNREIIGSGKFCQMPTTTLPVAHRIIRHHIVSRANMARVSSRGTRKVTVPPVV